MKVIIVTDKAPRPIGPYSQAVRAYGFLFTAQIALDPNTNTLLEGDVATANGTRAGKLEGDSHARRTNATHSHSSLYPLSGQLPNTTSNLNLTDPQYLLSYIQNP